MTSTAKEYYLNQIDYPLDDPLVEAWLAGTRPVDPLMAAHLQALTGLTAAFWTGRDMAYVSAGGRILPGRPAFVAERMEPWGGCFLIGIFEDLEEAEAARQRYNNAADPDLDASHARVRRVGLWLTPRGALP